MDMDVVCVCGFSVESFFEAGGRVRGFSLDGHWLGDSKSLKIFEVEHNVLPLEALDITDAEPWSKVFHPTKLFFLQLSSVVSFHLAMSKASCQLEDQMAQLALLKSEPLAVEHFLLSVLQPGKGTVDTSDHQLTAAGQAWKSGLWGVVLCDFRRSES